MSQGQSLVSNWTKSLLCPRGGGGESGLEFNPCRRLQDCLVSSKPLQTWIVGKEKGEQSQVGVGKASLLDEVRSVRATEKEGDLEERERETERETERDREKQQLEGRQRRGRERQQKY